MDYDNDDGYLSENTKKRFLYGASVVLLMITLLVMLGFAANATDYNPQPDPNGFSSVVIFKGRCCLWGTVCWEEDQHWHETALYESLLNPETPYIYFELPEEKDGGCFIDSLLLTQT